MKKLIFLLLFVPSFLFSQTEFTGLSAGKCNIQQTGSGSGYWTVGITQFNNPRGMDATYIAEGDVLYFNDSGVSFALPVDTVLSAVGNSASVRVLNSGITTISSVPTTAAGIAMGTSSYKIPPFFANMTDNNNQMVVEWAMYVIDSLIGFIDSADVIPLNPDIDFGGVSTITVQEALETIDVRLDSAFMHNNGRIWYVAKDNPSCSVNAEVGNPDRPFCNPWQAVDSLLEGDVVEIFPARYFISDTGGGGDLTVTSNWQAGRQLYKDNVIWYCHPGVVIENSSSFHIGVFNTNGVVTTTTGKKCSFLGYAKLLKSGSGRLDLAHDLTTTAGGDMYFEFYEGNFSGGGFDFRTRNIVSVKCKSLFEFNNNLGEYTYTKNTYFNADEFLKNSGVQPVFGLEKVADGGLIKIEANEFALRGAGHSSIFTYAGSPSGNDSTLLIFKVGRVKFYSSATFSYAGKIFAKNSSPSTGVNNYFKFEIGEIVDLTSDTMPMFNMVTTALSASTTVDVKIGRGYSIASLWQSNVNSSAKWIFDVGEWTNASTKPVFANYTTSTSGTLRISGRYVSSSAPVLRLQNSRSTWVRDAIFDCTNQTAILTNSEVNLRNTVLLSGSSAPIENITATPVSANCLGVYSNSTVVDADITEVVESIVRNTNIK